MKKYCIEQDGSIREAMEVIDCNLTSSAIVVDDKNIVVGMITDGDIRRALLGGRELDDSIRGMYTKNIKSLDYDCGNRKAKDIMLKFSIRQLPVLNEEGKLEKLYFLDDIISYDEKKEWVVIQAGGLGSRMRPLTNDRPKPLLEIGDKPVLEHIIDSFIYFGYKRFIITLNYKGDMIKEYFGNGDRYGCCIEYIKENKPLGTAGALSLCRGIIDSDDFIMVNGDILTGLDYECILSYHKESGSDFTAGATQYSVEIPYGVIETDGVDFLAVKEKPKIEFYVNSGIYVLKKSMLGIIEDDKYIGMTDVMEKAKASGFKGVVYPIKEFWRDIGHIDNYEKTNNEAKKLV